MRTTSGTQSVDGCLEAAQASAKLARQAYRAIVPVGDGLADVTDRIGLVSPARPDAPLLEAVATLTVASTAGQRALELSLARSNAGQIADITAALYETARSARLCVLSLGASSVGHPRMQLAHASGYACHLITEAMIMYEGLPARRDRNRRISVHLAPFPRAWRSLIAGLGTWLTQDGSIGVSDESRAAIVAAYAGAEHIARAYDQVLPVNGAVGAMRRYARISALAAAYAGWSIVDVAEHEVGDAT